MGNRTLVQISIEVLYAAPDRIWRRQLELPAGASVQQAIKASGVMNVFPELGEVRPRVGIYGRECPPRQVLQAGDRVEIYRPLVFDPMESRRRRMRHRQRKRARSGT